mgnify:CR=1 FL=1
MPAEKNWQFELEEYIKQDEPDQVEKSKQSLFLFQWFNSKSGKQQLLQSIIETLQSALTIENLKKIKLIVPTKALIKDYHQKAHFMLEQKSALQINNRNLAAQRDMLLPRLMSGKLEV